MTVSTYKSLIYPITKYALSHSSLQDKAPGAGNSAVRWWKWLGLGEM